MANGFLLGGIADELNRQTELGQRDRQLGIGERANRLAERTLENDRQNQLMIRADKAIGDTMGVIGETIKGAASSPDLGTGLPAWREAVAGIESSGNGDYAARGPVTATGDRAWGRYGVMGANIPQWTEEVLGRPLTPEEFAASPAAQDAVFDAKFGQFVDETGSPDGAALKWFTGSADAGAAGKSDVLGTTGADYLQKFAANLADQPRRKIAAAVAPLLKDVTDIAKRTGRNPANYENMVNAAITTTPIAVDAALKAGEDAAKTKLGEANALIRAGVARADALATAGVKMVEGGIPDPKDRAELTQKLRKEYTDLSSDYVTVRDAHSRIGATSDTAAGDIALIFNYMKMLDPNSTVREGEFATAQNATGVSGYLVNLYNQAVQGTRLNPAQRADMRSQADRLFTAKQTQQSALIPQFTRIAQKAGLDPSDVLLDFSPAGTEASLGSTANGDIDALVNKYAP